MKNKNTRTGKAPRKEEFAGSFLCLRFGNCSEPDKRLLSLKDKKIQKSESHLYADGRNDIIKECSVRIKREKTPKQAVQE